MDDTGVVGLGVGGLCGPDPETLSQTRRETVVLDEPLDGDNTTLRGGHMDRPERTGDPGFERCFGCHGASLPQPSASGPMLYSHGV